MDDEDRYESPYDNGIWSWDAEHNHLEFKSLNPATNTCDQAVPPERIAGSLLFKEDLDLFEQLRFKNRFQRRSNENAVVTLQDIRDVTLFCAPPALLSENVINMFHTPLMDRFLRALIFYCQYYLQIRKEMEERSQANKIRTPKSDQIEAQFYENTEDLRLLVAKVYSSMILGAGSFVKYHHMGRSKRHSSLIKDAVLFETLIRISIHIVWIALGRKSQEEIQLEVNRMFKSDRFNFAAHKNMFKKNSKMAPEKSLILGRCLRKDTMLTTTSPLLQEIFCYRYVDSRMLSLGIQKLTDLPPRLLYLEGVLILPEEDLVTANISLGILGLPRNRFDTMLREITNIQSNQSVAKSSQSTTTAAVGSKNSMKTHKLYADIVLPEIRALEYADDTFPEEMIPQIQSNSAQRKKWLSRFRHRKQGNDGSIHVEEQGRVFNFHYHD